MKIIISLLLVVSVSTCLVFAQPSSVYIFGTFGSANGQFDVPQDITVSSSGNVYVTDTSNNRIEKFSLSGTFVSAFGSSGKKDGEFNLPKGIALDKSGNIFVVDQSNSRVQKFSSFGTFVMSFGGKSSGQGQLNTPRDVAIDSSNNVYVTDQQKGKIMKYDSNGKYVSTIGSSGSGDGQFKQPLGLAIDKNNKIYVMDSQNHRYQVFSSSGTHLLTVGRLGVANGQFDSPEDIAVSDDGSVYVSDTGNNRIQKFDSNGNFIYSFGTYGSQNTQFNGPRGLALYQNSLYVVDSLNNRVQIIQSLDFVPDTTAPVITVPSNISISATSPSGSAVSYSASATDDIDGTVSVSCIPQSGSTFASGTTTVTCSASDLAGNQATKSFTITVSEYTPNDSTVYLTQSTSTTEISSTSSITQVIVASGINAQLTFSPVTSNQIITPDNQLTVKLNQQTNGSIDLMFSPQTTISGNSFSGVLQLNEGGVSSCATNITLEDETIKSCVAVGDQNTRLTVSPPMRIKLSGQSEFTPYYAQNSNEQRVLITTKCVSDNVNSVKSQIGGTGQPDTCYVVVGQDMIIWSSHFTSFGTLTKASNTTTQTQDAKSTSGGNRPPPKIFGLGMFKILISADDAVKLESQKFEDFFPYSMQSYVSDSLTYGENFFKIGQFFPLKGYSNDVLPITTNVGDKIQFQIRLYDDYRGNNIEHVAIYFTNKEPRDITSTDTFVSYEKDGGVKISDPKGIFTSAYVTPSSEFDSYWAIFDIQFANNISTSDILIETWNESHFPAYAKVVNTLVISDPLAITFNDKEILKTAEIRIPQTHTSPECAPKNECFAPSDATILKGGIVSWINKDTTFVHAITSGTPDAGPDNKFNGFLKPLSSFDFQFNHPGNYPYYCAIHPWSKGIVHVVQKAKDSSTDVTADVTSGNNVSGNVRLPESFDRPLVVESVASGINQFAEAGKTLILPTKNLSVHISGNVGKKPTHDVEISIIRPDDSVDNVKALANDDGDYFYPTKLNTKWQSGTYEVIVTYNGIQIGNIPFSVKSDDGKGFGGILPSPSATAMFELERYVSGILSGTELAQKLDELGFSKLQIQDLKEKTRQMFLVDSPLQQLQSGISPDDVSCNVGLTLVKKQSNNMSLCVKKESVNDLKSRGIVASN